LTGESRIITNGSQLGVNGIDVPISGSCSGKHSSFYQVDEKRIREDRIKTQVTVSDMIAKIRKIESLNPSYPKIRIQGDNKLEQKEKDKKSSKRLKELNKLKKHLKNQQSLSVGFGTDADVVGATEIVQRKKYETIEKEQGPPKEYGSFGLDAQQQFKEEFNSTVKIEKDKNEKLVPQE
jgi:hypothetical protein